MREIRLYGSEGGEAFNPLSLPLSFCDMNPAGRAAAPRAPQAQAGFSDKLLGGCHRRASDISVIRN